MENGHISWITSFIWNHAMGTVFEELVRKFNEENNEEAGEHWTPRDAVRLMATLIFRPVADRIKSGGYLIYDCACGTGGMLTVAEETLERPLRLHSRLTAKAIESLRFASGDDDLRASLHEEFGDDLFADFTGMASRVEAFPANWSPESDKSDLSDWSDNMKRWSRASRPSWSMNPDPDLRTLEEIATDILAVEKEAEGLLDGLLKGVTA